MRELAKVVAHSMAWLAVTPSVWSWHVRSWVVGSDKALESSTQAWALVPGLPGLYLRRAFLCRTLRSCARTATVEFGTLFSSASAEIGERVYIGPRCHIGWAVIEPNVLIAAGVHIPSGARTHGTNDATVPIREQPVEKTAVRIGTGAWIGSAAVVMADVGCDAVIGAGAVVTKAIPQRAVAGGVPARVLRMR